MHARNGAGEVILDRGLGTGGDEGDGLDRVEALDRDPEKEFIVCISGDARLETIDDGGILGVGVGLGIELFNS